MKGNASLGRALCLFPVGALLAASLACSLGGTPAEPTSPSPTVVSEKPTPTERSLQRPTPTEGHAAPSQAPSSGPLQLAAEVYDHPSGAFELTPPEGWELDEGKSLATWTAPDGSGQIEIYVNTTGYALNQDAVAKFVQANEENYLQPFDDYKVIDRGTDSVGATVVQQSVTKDGGPWFVTSCYFQSKDAIYEAEFWVEQAAAEAYQPTYEEI
jgi:hypothetical protein